MVRLPLFTALSGRALSCLTLSTAARSNVTLTGASAFLVAAALSAACGNPTPQTAGDADMRDDAAALDERPPPEAPVLTEDQRKQVEQAARVGKLLYEHDAAAARASDFLLTRDLPLEAHSHGWVTVHEGGTWSIPFLFKGEDDPGTLHTVHFEGNTAPTVTTTQHPTQAPARIQQMFTALDTVKQKTANMPMCTRNINPVVLPAEELGKSGWLVYLLAATRDSGAVVAGGHHRFLVSLDGKEVIEHFEFTRACLTIPPPPPGGETAASVLTHLTSQTPTEIHVFLSYLHRVPVLVTVANPRAVWGVSGPRIEQIPLDE
jgi:hypothetical protein